MLVWGWFGGGFSKILVGDRNLGEPAPTVAWVWGGFIQIWIGWQKPRWTRPYRR